MTYKVFEKGANTYFLVVKSGFII